MRTVGYRAWALYPVHPQDYIIGIQIGLHRLGYTDNRPPHLIAAAGSTAAAAEAGRPPLPRLACGGATSGVLLRALRSTAAGCAAKALTMVAAQLTALTCTSSASRTAAGRVWVEGCTQVKLEVIVGTLSRTECQAR